jgi:acetyl-CoA C-acetyltransferase
VARADYSGSATIEAYTLPYARDGQPEAAIAAALAPDGTRVLARSSDRELVAQMVEQDPLGLRATISAGTLASLS